jgi:hypothetical protein
MSPVPSSSLFPSLSLFPSRGSITPLPPPPTTPPTPTGIGSLPPDVLDSIIRAPHNLVVEVVAYPPSGDPIRLDIADGTVTIDRTADHRRRLDLVVSNPLVYPVTPSDPVNVYGTEITVARGVELAGGAVTLVPQGVFRVEEVSRSSPSGDITVTGWDRSRQILDQRFIHPRKFAAMGAIALITTLIQEVYPGAVIHDTSGDATTIPKHTVDRDRWPEIQRVAQVIGCEVFADRNGEWVIQPVPDPSTVTVPDWVIDAGETGSLSASTTW